MKLRRPVIDTADEALHLPAGLDFSVEAEKLRLISHPVRLKIVVGLMDAACCVKTIWNCLAMPQATVSQHLSVLRAHGIIAGEREGTSIRYRLVDPFVQDFVAWLRVYKGIGRSISA